MSSFAEWAIASVVVAFAMRLVVFRDESSFRAALGPAAAFAIVWALGLISAWILTHWVPLDAVSIVAVCVLLVAGAVVSRRLTRRS